MAGRATSQIAATMSALVAVARQVLVDEHATRVWDGPAVSDGDDPDVMWIGVDNPFDDDGVAAAVVGGEQDWGSIGNYARDERFIVNAAFLSWTGTANSTAGEDDGTGTPYPDVFATCRDRAFERIALLEQAIRDDASVGALLQAPGSTLRQVGMQVVSVTAVGTPGEGSGVLVGFQFLCWCRI